MANGWICARCGTTNDETAYSCRSCRTIRGGVVTGPNQMMPPPVPTPGVPAPGGYPGAPTPLAPSSPKRQMATGCLANIGIRLAVLGVIVIIGLVAAYVSSAGRDSNGNINKAGELKPSELQVGDCYDLQGGNPGSFDPNATIEKTNAMPCAQPHHYEVFYTGKLTGDTYPTDADLNAWTDANCTPAFETYVGTTADKTTLTYYVFYPDNGSWSNGDRGVQCSLADPDLKPLTGSLKGSGR